MAEPSRPQRYLSQILLLRLLSMVTALIGAHSPYLATMAMIFLTAIKILSTGNQLLLHTIIRRFIFFIRTMEILAIVLNGAGKYLSIQIIIPQQVLNTVTIWGQIILSKALICLNIMAQEQTGTGSQKELFFIKLRGIL